MRTSARFFLVAVLVLSYTVSIYAQETLWKGLFSKFIMLYEQGRYSEAAKLAEEALTVAEKIFGPDHPNVEIVYENMAKLYRKTGKEDEAERLEERARRIRSNQ
jgi:tetratricopeptide (TPR) repeat protein